ncbi:MAG TPA: VWA domain-containing protein [Candidatus Limnocylindrales bacterium]|nr:VWA domain-containing protein [Candidatus Limnocylindrales bacterium]
MTLLAPAAGVLAVSIPAILALYFLRIRRPTRVIPALHLWPQRVQDRQANVPWQRLRPSWLLFLQLLAAALLVGAALQPVLPVGAGLARHTIVLLDTSASMQARDVTPTRLDEAKSEVARLIDQLAADERMTLISVSPTPQVIASAVGDRGALHQALGAATASNGPGDLSAALTLAAGLVRPGDDATAVLFSDGILGPVSSAFTDGLPFPLAYHRIGVSGENVAITSLTVRTSTTSRAALLRVENFGQQTRAVSIDFRADGHLRDVRAATLKGGTAQDLAFAVPADATVVTAQIEGGDLFPVDDQATAIARAPRPLRVLLVTPGNVFLEQALRLRGDFQLDVQAPSAYRPGTAYAMTVFDRFLPPTGLSGPALVIDPPAGSTLAGGTPVGIGRVRAVDAGDPLLAHVDLQDVHVARSQDLRASSFGRALITSAQTPLVLARDQPFRQVLVGFDLHESDLPLRVAFPILMENLTEWMLPPSVPSHSFHPDEPVTIVPEPGARSVTVQRPDGSRLTIAPGGITTFAATDQLGLYTVVQAVPGREDRSWFSVNLFDPSISQLKPVDRLTLPPSRVPSGTTSTRAGQFELWPWLLALALLVLLGEWVAFHRGL